MTETTTVEFILGADIRSWTKFTVTDATQQEVNILSGLNTEEAVALARALDEADRLVWVDTDYDDNPDLFADYASPDVIECEVTPVWWRVTDRRGMWHRTRVINPGPQVQIITALCGTSVGDDGSVLSSVGFPTQHPICKRCRAINERRTA